MVKRKKDRTGSIEKDILILLDERDSVRPNLKIDRVDLLRLMLNYICLPKKINKGKVLTNKFYRALRNLEDKRFVNVEKDNILLTLKGKTKVKEVRTAYDDLTREWQIIFIKWSDMGTKIQSLFYRKVDSEIQMEGLLGEKKG